MQVNSVSQPQTANAALPQQELGGNAFMTLLVAQLQAQDPFQPMDPTAMVGQLVQFNSLNELIQIRQSLQGALTSGTAAIPSSAQTSNP